MASTFSDLKFELIGTGDQSGTWGTTTNDNIGTAIEEAITGSADVTFASADVTVTLTDTVAAQTARNLRLNLTGTTGGARNLILGSGCQIEKLYLINNGTADTITVKNTTGTGIAVPAGKSMFVYNNATNVVDATTYLSSLTLGTALPITSGGTGSTSTTFVNLTTNVTGTLPVANGGTGLATTTSYGLIAAGTTSTGNFQQVSGTGTSGQVLTSNGAGALPTWQTGASGNVTTSGNNAFTGANTFYNATGQAFAQATANDGFVVQGRAGGSSTYRVTFTMAALSASRTVTFPDADVNFATGLGVANGGTGATTLTANNVILGNGTSAVQFVAPGANGNVLTSNGTTWVSQTGSGGGAQGFVTQFTGGNQPPASYNPSDSFALI